MKTQIVLNESHYFLHFSSQKEDAPAILIVPNSAGYFAESPKYGVAGPRIDKFCTDLSKEYEVYYLVLQGQDKKYQRQYYSDAKYTYKTNIEVVAGALETLEHKTTKPSAIPVAVIGICTGAAIAVEAMEKTGYGKTPFILYNTAAKVGWNDPAIQKVFLRRYGNFVNLDCSELQRNAPGELIPVIEKHQGKMLQVISGNSDYKKELQEEISRKIPRITSKTFLTMSDAPISESEEYQTLLGTIFDFLK